MSRHIFPTTRKEGFKTRLKRLVFNLFPSYRRTGGRIAFISDDWHEIHVALRFRLATRNYVGSVFGGSIYGALDPIYMVQLIVILGKDYVVWDKAATVKFIKPIRGKVYARFEITDELLADIKARIATDKKYVLDLPVVFVDAKGVVYAEVSKTLYIADKDWYAARKESKTQE